MSKKKNKSSYKVLAEAIVGGKLKDAKVSVEHLNLRKLSIDEIKSVIKEAFEDAKDVSKVKADEPEKGWADADLEKQVDWVKKLDLKEFFNIIKSKTK